MTMSRRDWDVIVVGLGAIGSAAAYWLADPARRRVPRPRAVRARPRQRRLGRPQPDHPAVLPPPDYVRLAKRAYETWAEVEAEAGERIVTVTGGLDLWPADAAIPQTD